MNKIISIVIFIFGFFQTGCSVIGIGLGAAIGVKAPYTITLEKNNMNENISGKCKIIKISGEEKSGTCYDESYLEKFGYIKNYYFRIEDSVVYKKDLNKVEKQGYKKSRLGGAILGGLAGFIIDIILLQRASNSYNDYFKNGG